MSLRLWDEHVVPRLADLSLRGHAIGDMRRAVCAGLAGEVVEIGFGSGLNVRWYPEGVASVSAIEPSEVGWHLSQPRRLRSEVPIIRAGLDGEALDLPDASHDHALTTFSLCTIPDPALALLELRRVLRPGGRLHFIEHGLAPDEDVRRRQRRWEPLQRRAAGGCHLTRNVLSLLADTGWQPLEVSQNYLDGPWVARPWTYISSGVANIPEASPGPRPV